MASVNDRNVNRKDSIAILDSSKEKKEKEIRNQLVDQVQMNEDEQR
jgi:hypothetical protein